MKELQLKYGCNPNQFAAKIYMHDNSELPITILNGNVGYINLLDALNGWQLVQELKRATGYPAATSFKHLSPTSAAIATNISTDLKRAYFVDDIIDLDSSPQALAYAKARGADRLCSFGDFIALSDTCDEITAKIIAREVSDGVIAPAYTEEALRILKEKRKGCYNVLQIDKDYIPQELERREVFGITFQQNRNNIQIDKNICKNIVTENKNLPEEAKLDLIIALITLKYTQSNSICYAKNGQAIGVGAGQQSRIHCTRLAGNKADIWHLRQHQKVLNLPFLEHISRPEKDNIVDRYIANESNLLQENYWQKFFLKKPEEFTSIEQKEYLSKIRGVSLGSDAFFPFADNIERAVQSGVSYIAESGGSIRDAEIIAACNRHNVTLIFTNLRLFHH